MTSLPIIDLAAYRHGTTEAAAALVEEVASKSRELGFFYLVNHGLGDALLTAQLSWTRRFFDLPSEAKAALDFRNTPVRRGYEPLAAQTLQAGMPPDHKETFTFGRELPDDHWLMRANAPFEGRNQWPPAGPSFDAEGFRAQMETWRDAMIGLGTELCGLLAASLALPKDFFVEVVNDPNVSVRLLHYPPRPERGPANQLSCGAHTDWGLITLLLQDDCGGLEVSLPSGGWLDAAPVSGSLIVNLGDMVVRLTGGRYASNVHRVLNKRPNRDRYSVATFFNPNAFYMVACAPTCASETGTSQPIRFADHINAMIARTYGRPPRR